MRRSRNIGNDDCHPCDYTKIVQHSTNVLKLTGFAELHFHSKRNEVRVEVVLKVA
jgi:hypothetical protein